MMATHPLKQGFSLIEVCLAVLIVGLGLIPIFGLFPSGLRAMEEGTADTRCGLFTETVMTGMRANAAMITNWSEWTNPYIFTNDIVQGLFSGAMPNMGPNGEREIQFPSGGDWLRYRLTIQTTSPQRPSALLEVRDGRYGRFDPPQSTSYTEFYFQGM
jgi:hypothetical protein